MPLTITASANITVSPVTSNTGTLSEPAMSTNAASIITANSNRKGLTIFNSGNNSVFVGYANTVSASSYAFELPSKAYYEMPASPLYTGGIWGITASGASQLEVVEFV